MIILGLNKFVPSMLHFLALDQELHASEKEEPGPIEQVATPEFLRLPEEAIDPFEARLADPWRATADDARQEPKRSAHTNSNWDLELVSVLVDPDVLLRHSERYPEDVGTGSVDFLDDHILFSRCLRAKWRRVAASYPVTWIDAGDSVCERGQCYLGVAVKETTIASFVGTAQELPHDLRAGRTGSIAMTPKPRKPHRRYAIWNPKVCSIQDRANM